MLAATKVKMSGRVSGISSIKRVTGKFLEVSRCSRAKQRQRNVQKVCCTCNVAFLPIRPIVVFHRSLFLRRLALHDYMFCWSKLLILSTASLLALAKSINYSFWYQFSVTSTKLFFTGSGYGPGAKLSHIGGHKLDHRHTRNLSCNRTPFLRRSWPTQRLDDLNRVQGVCNAGYSIPSYHQSCLTMIL